MFETAYKFPLRVFHGDFKKARGHTLQVSTVHPDGSRALRLDMMTPTGEVQTIEAQDIERIVRSESTTDAKSTFHLFPMGINRQRLPIAGAMLALTVILPVFPLIVKILTGSVVATVVLLEPHVRVVIEMTDGRYACVIMSERAFGMMGTLCNRNIGSTIPQKQGQ